MAKLGKDMISLAETPRLVTVHNAYGPFGANKTDDKPFLHQNAGVYYLSWGCFYATATNPYGPYTYQGTSRSLGRGTQSRRKRYPEGSLGPSISKARPA